MIRSADDPRLADYRLTARPADLARAGLLVAEGRFVVQRLLASPRFRVRSVLVTPPAHRALAADVPPGVACLVVEQTVMDQVIGFNIHRGCLALAERPPLSTIDDLPLEAARRLLVLEGVNNPDNVGGLFRSAAAFGVDAVLLGPACGDPLYRKAIRTSMAATLQVPFADAGAWPGGLSIVKRAGFRVLALTPAPDARALEDLPRSMDRVALLVGTEGAGLTADALAAADERVTIRMRGGVDSLNVTVAASIALHHFGAASLGAPPGEAGPPNSQ